MSKHKPLPRFLAVLFAMFSSFKHKKLSSFLTVLLLIIFTLGAIGVGVFASRVSAQLQTSILSADKSDRAKLRMTSKLVAQLVVPPTILNPLTVCMHIPQEKPEYKAELISQEIQGWTEPGQEFEAYVYVRNSGNTTWFGDSSGCAGVNYMRLGTARERDRDSVFYNPGDSRWVTPNRISMVEQRVEPGEIATFAFRSRAPRVADIFREYFQPVIENTNWFESKEETAHLDLYVGQVDAETEQKLLYLNKSGQASTLDLSGDPVIEVDISEQKMIFKFGDTIVREFTVSTGKEKTPTPLGTFKILNKQELRIGGAAPHYRMPMWQGFTQWGHGLHALPSLGNDRGVFWTEALNHIGQRVSHGCIRMLPEDAEDLYSLTTVGLKVVVHG